MTAVATPSLVRAATNAALALLTLVVSTDGALKPDDVEAAVEDDVDDVADEVFGDAVDDAVEVVEVVEVVVVEPLELLVVLELVVVLVPPESGAFDGALFDPEPLELTGPAKTIPLASMATPPALPPVVETLPPTLIVCAVAVTSLAIVELPEAKLTVTALMTSAPFWPRLIVPLLATVPVAFKVRVVPAVLVVENIASVSILRSPLTSIVTLAVCNTDETTAAVDAVITISSGSSNQLPLLPALAVTSTTADFRISRLLEELVSTKPPSPPSRPPRAFKIPDTTVFSLDQILISPPFPFSVDETSTRAPSATVTVLARFSARTFVRVLSAFSLNVTFVVPTLISPPFVLPFAVVVEPVDNSIALPRSVMEPPLPELESALTTPACLMLSPVSEILPPFLWIPEAEICPELLMVEPIRSCAAFAAIKT